MGTLAPAQQTWLGALLALWAALLFGGFLFGTPDRARTRRMPVWTRMLSSLVLVVAAWSWWWFGRGSAVVATLILAALGMTGSLLGDLFLALVVPLPLSPTGHRLAGIGAFSLGHVAYIAALLMFAQRQGLSGASVFWVAWLTWLLFGLLLWYFVLYRGHRPTVLHAASLPYALLLASTAGVATGVAAQAGVLLPVALGAALFLFSDLMVAANLFNATYFPLIHDVIWLMYGPAQALIVYGIGLGSRLVG